MLKGFQGIPGIMSPDSHPNGRSVNFSAPSLTSDCLGWAEIYADVVGEKSGVVVQSHTTLHHSWSHPFGSGKDSLMIRQFQYLCCGVVKLILTGLWWSSKTVSSCSIWSPEWCAEIACQRALAPRLHFSLGSEGWCVYMSYKAM